MAPPFPHLSRSGIQRRAQPISFIGFISLIAWTHGSSTPAVATGQVSHGQKSGANADAPVAPSKAAMLHTIRWDLAKFGVAAIIILAASRCGWPAVA